MPLSDAMDANRFGQIFSITTFGESHGAALGCVVDGCPAGLPIDLEHIQAWMDRRRPGQNALTSARQEPDQVEILSGVFEGRSLGTPIALMVRNQDARSKDYSREKVAQRPGHAADLWQEKFGHSDFRGSGRASGRETVSRVMGGAIAQRLAKGLAPESQIVGFVSELGPWKLSPSKREGFLAGASDWSADAFAARLPDEELSGDVTAGLLKAKEQGESFGGVCEVVLRGIPSGLGQPVFHKLKTDLAAAMMSVGAVSGAEFGEGFSATDKKGGEFHAVGQQYGGLRGGISTGDPISLRVAFKPAATRGAMAREGRHDPAILPRAVPVLEAMAWIVLADHLLWRRLDRI